jgi:hypothetical protein
MDAATAARQVAAALASINPPTSTSTTAPSTQSNLVNTNIIYSPKFGPLDFSNDVWARAYRSGDGSSRTQTYAIAMNFGGKEYAFIPEDRIQKGWYADGQYNYSPAFLNENTIRSLATNAEYIDLTKAPVPSGWANADSRVKSEDVKTYGDYLSKSTVGASPKGFLVPVEQLGNYFPSYTHLDPKYGALTGLARDPDTGELGYAATGLGNIQAPIAKANRVSFYEKPTGFLADLGRSIRDMGPIATFALNLAVPGLGTGIGVGRAIGLGDIEGAAKALVIGEIIGQTGVAQDVANVTGSGALGTAAAGTVGGLLSGQNIGEAITTGATQGALSGVAGTIAENQAADYIENLPIPDYLSAGPATTSADVMATFPETNPANFVGPPTDIDTTLLDLTTPSNIVGPPVSIDTTLLDLSTAAPPLTQTYTYEDGSTLTVDESGGVVGYTDATETPYKGVVETPSNPLTKAQVEGIIKLGLTVAGASAAANAVQDAISSGDADTTTQTGFPFTPSDISGWARPEYTKTFQGPIDLNSLFTTDNLLGGTQWAGLQGNQFANIPQVSMSDFISSIQNGKV